MREREGAWFLHVCRVLAQAAVAADVLPGADLPACCSCYFFAQQAAHAVGAMGSPFWGNTGNHAPAAAEMEERRKVVELNIAMQQQRMQLLDVMQAQPGMFVIVIVMEHCNM